MSTIAFLFPGQGSQEIGMGRDLFGADPHFKRLMDLGSELTGDDLSVICGKGPEKKIVNPRFLQPLMTAVALGYNRHCREAGIRPDFVCGHSLGEIAALAAAGAISDEDAVRISAKRGELMEQTALRISGGMLALFFISLDTAERLVREIDAPGRLVLANDNAHNQVVISGGSAELDRLARRIHEEKAGKCQRLPVAGPWHSPYMQVAQDEFAAWVRDIPFHEPLTACIMNATGAVERDPEILRGLITRQLTSPVYWRACMETLKAKGVSALAEIGPNRVLLGLARVNGLRRGIDVYSVSSRDGVRLVAEKFGTGRNAASPAAEPLPLAPVSNEIG